MLYKPYGSTGLSVSALGFGGMSTALNTDIPTFNPCLPKEFGQIRFQAVWKGQRFAVTITENILELENISETGLHFRVKNQVFLAAANEKTMVNYQ